MDETINRLKQDIASKGITFFTAIDQSKLAADAGMALHPSTLLVFGNPALGAQFVWRASTGPCGFWFTKTKPERYGPPIRTSFG
jgi:hypothetical protein